MKKTKKMTTAKKIELKKLDLTCGEFNNWLESKHDFYHKYVICTNIGLIPFECSKDYNNKADFLQELRAYLDFQNFEVTKIVHAKKYGYEPVELR